MHSLRVTVLLTVLGLASTTAACTRASLPPKTTSTSAAVASHPAVATDWSRLRAPLESLFDADQNERKRVWETQLAADKAGHPWTKAEIDANWEHVKTLDADNVRTLDAFLQEHGWPPVDRVGDKAELGAFLVLQHASLAMQERYLPMLREAVAKQEAEAGNLALLEDRVALDEGRGQIYGSQVTPTAGRVTLVEPVADPARLDERRAKLGLQPICEYLAEFRDQGPAAWPPCVAGGVKPQSDRNGSEP
jgi:hypothetical protein